MNKVLSNVGKLRNEMRVGFMELENQLSANNDSLQKKILETSSLTISAMDRFSKKVEAGFLAVELEKDLSDINDEIANIKKRLDDANI